MHAWRKRDGNVPNPDNNPKNVYDLTSDVLWHWKKIILPINNKNKFQTIFPEKRLAFHTIKNISHLLSYTEGIQESTVKYTADNIGKGIIEECQVVNK